MTKPFLICVLELLLLLLLGSVDGIILPEHNCPEYFTYGIEDGTTYIGLFTAPAAGLTSISWNVSFVWQGSRQIPIASLDHYPNKQEATLNINRGRRAQLIARFTNVSHQLPQLLNLQVNNQELCNNPGGGNKVTYTRGITATRAIRVVDNRRPEVHPIFPTIAPKISFGGRRS